MKKEHKGVIHGQRIHLPDGDILMGLFVHQDGRVSLLFTSVIVKTDGCLVETENSYYTFQESKELPADLDVYLATHAAK